MDAFEIFFPSWRSLAWIEAVNPVKLLGEVLARFAQVCAKPSWPCGSAFAPRQVRLLTLQLLGHQFLLGNIHRGAEKSLKDFAFNNGNSDAANVALFAVG